MRYSIDTNILVYSIQTGSDPRFAMAQNLVRALIEQDCVITQQALNEFYYVTTRKQLLEAHTAEQLVKDWATLHYVASAKIQTTVKAIGLSHNGIFSFWDALLVCAAEESNTDILLSEDMQDGYQHAGLKIVNPFANSLFE